MIADMKVQELPLFLFSVMKKSNSSLGLMILQNSIGSILSSCAIVGLSNYAGFLLVP